MNLDIPSFDFPIEMEELSCNSPPLDFMEQKSTSRMITQPVPRFDMDSLSKKSIFVLPKGNSEFEEISYCISPYPETKEWKNNENKSKENNKKEKEAKKVKLTADNSYELKRLDHICHVLARVFNGEGITECFFDLREKEKELVHCLFDKVIEKIQKNFKKKKRLKAQEKLERLKGYIITKNYNLINEEVFKTDFIHIKRKEEKSKFVMKNAINAFRKLFFVNNDLKSCKESELLFLNYYFKEHKLKFHMPIENFSDPLNNRLIKNEKFKALSNDYLKTIFSVKSFRNAFLRHLDQRFKKDYQRKIESKFKKVFGELYEKFMFESKLKFDDAIDGFIAKLKKRKVVKIPWFNSEIDNAIFSFKANLQKII